MIAGQGVVTVRSPFSTGIFTNAMRECNYISEPGKKYKHNHDNLKMGQIFVEK